VRIAYVVSRFPDPSETFVLRELNAVARRPGIELELFSLFPPKNPFVHPDAEAWVPRLHRATPGASAAGLLWWGVRRPVRLARSLATVFAAHLRQPRRLLRALAACGPAAAHARTMRALGIEHVHAHFATYPALAAWLAHRLLDVPYSFTAHAHDIYIDQLQLGTLVREASAVATISDFNRELLRPYGAGSATRCELVRCGVDPSAYAFRPRTVPAAGPVKAICVATLNELKGHSVLLDALAQGGPELERVQLDLVGSGPLEARLRAQAERLGIAGRVRFHGTRSEREVAELLGAADLFVLASVRTPIGWMDGIPVALMEALAAGLPVIASRLSGIPELVRDGETGVLAAPGDPADLARAFARVLADPEATLARAHAGRALIEREFDIERSAERMLGVLGVSAAG
jgi:glycosyltransferase involved in cell wall biosynthesis